MSNWNKLQNKLDVKINKLIVPVGKVSGTLYTVLGLVGIIGFGIPITVMLILGFVIGIKAVFHSIAIGLLPLLIISVLSLVNGNKTRNRLRRFQRYTSKLNNRYYCPIKDLAVATGQTQQATARDLQKMIEIGMFPQGHIDEQSVYFMLNNKYYDEYKRLQHNAKIKTIEAKNKERNSPRNQLTPDQRKVIDDGRALIEDIKHVNDLIPGEDLSNKIRRLEEVGEKIFEYVEAHPEKLSQIKKFTEYFLPTTLKLADTYAKLDHQPIQGQNISSVKREIEETMDTIYDAFENLLDGLFEDVALDISTDISVLETIFAQEGLTQNSMTFENKQMEENK